MSFSPSEAIDLLPRDPSGAVIQYPWVTQVHQELINSRFAYVSVSRASVDAQIFTNDAATLAESLSRDVSKASAVDFVNTFKAVQTQLVDTKQKTVTANGLGLAL